MPDMPDVSTRFSADLFHSATVEGARQSRSAKEQLDHWARVGRAIDAQQSVARRRVDAAMAGELPTVDLSREESAVFNAEVTASIEQRVAAADIGATLAAQGQSFVALDDAGDLVEYHPDGSSDTLASAKELRH